MYNGTMKRILPLIIITLALMLASCASWGDREPTVALEPLVEETVPTAEEEAVMEQETALVGAAGAVQIASIIASKPVPPQFYAGGIIGGANGASMGSDNTYIHARTGEMVLNAHQQRSLWDMINGQDSRQQAGLNLTINNTQANRVDADVREQDGEVFIDILDKHINKGFSDGTYDAGLAAMNTRQEGVIIL